MAQNLDNMENLSKKKVEIESEMNELNKVLEKVGSLFLVIASLHVRKARWALGLSRASLSMELLSDSY